MECHILSHNVALQLNTVKPHQTGHNSVCHIHCLMHNFHLMMVCKLEI
jgi:hypothetical protein